MKWLKYKWYRFLWWFAGKTKIPNLVHVDIETTSNCNLHCVFCPHDQGFKNKGEMKYSMAVQVVDDAKRMGVKSLKYNFRGEPGLYKRLENLVDYCQGKFTELFMNTNGIPYTESRIRALRGLDRIKISIDGATKQTYESIRLGDDKNRWKKLNRNIQLFKEHGHNVQLQMTVTKNNQQEVEQFKQKFRGIPVSINKERQILTERQHCPQPYRRMIVAHDGTVYGCCNSWWDQFPIGDFNKQSLREIWRGDRMKQLRKHAKEYTGPCANCDIREAWKR